MMIFGMLYFDSTYKLSAFQMIELARVAFERRQEMKATVAILPMSVSEMPIVEGLIVTQSYMVQPHNALVGVPLEDKFPHQAIKLTRSQ